MRTLVVVSLSFIACVMLGSCASTGPQASTADEPITQSELNAYPYASVMDAMRRLRPIWVREVRVAFVNGIQTSLRDLNALPVEIVARMGVISVGEAIAKYGTGPFLPGEAKVLEVLTK